MFTNNSFGGLKVSYLLFLGALVPLTGSRILPASEGAVSSSSQDFLLDFSPLSPTAEEEIMSQLVQDDNEIVDEKSETSPPLESLPQQEKHASSPLILPTYLQYLQDIEDFREQEDAGGYPYEEKRNNRNVPLARVWLPLEIKEQNTNTHTLHHKNKRSFKTSVMFQQTQTVQELGDFAKAEIVLTKRDSVDITEQEKAGIHLLVNVKQQQHLQEDLPPQEVTSTEKYYALNITQFLLHHLVTDTPTLDHPNRIDIDLQLQLVQDGEKTRDIFLYEIFDLQVERPFIMFSYQKAPQKDFFGGKHGHRKSSKSRKTRSIPSVTSTLQVTPTSDFDLKMPSHLCRRVTWEVDAYEDIEWYDMIQPKRLELGFCAGSCPFPLQNDHFNYTLHTFFVDRHRFNKVFNVPKSFPKESCCVPVSYKPLKAWILEEENSIVRKSFSDVTVDKCGCR